MPLLVIAAVVFWNSSGLPSPLIAVLAIEYGVVRMLRKQLTETFRSTEQAFDNLRLLAALTERLEREPAQTALAKRLVAQLSSEGLRASQAIGRLGTVVQFVESRRNFIIAILDLPLLYSVHAASRRSAGGAITATRCACGWRRSARSRR